MLDKYHYHQYSYHDINCHYYCITWAVGRAAGFRSPSPVKSTCYAWQQLLQIGILTGYKTFSDWLWTLGRKARLVKFGLGLGGGRGPEVYSHDRCRLVG